MDGWVLRELGGHMSDNENSILIRALIDANLKRSYQQTLNEELPERFVQLIAKLRAGAFDASDAGTNGEGAP